MQIQRALFKAVIAVASGALLWGCSTQQATELPKNEIHQQLQPVQEKALTTALRRHSARGLYIAPDIPTNKLANARRACLAPENEMVFALVDSTVFGSADRCLLIGSSGVFFQNGWFGQPPGRHYFSYVDFGNMVIGPGQTYSTDVSIGGLEFSMAGSEMSAHAAVALLREVQDCILNPSPLQTRGRLAARTTGIEAKESDFTEDDRLAFTSDTWSWKEDAFGVADLIGTWQRYWLVGQKWYSFGEFDMYRISLGGGGRLRVVNELSGEEIENVSWSKGELTLLG